MVFYSYVAGMGTESDVLELSLKLQSHLCGIQASVSAQPQKSQKGEHLGVRERGGRKTHFLSPGLARGHTALTAVTQ